MQRAAVDAVRRRRRALGAIALAATAGLAGGCRTDQGYLPVLGTRRLEYDLRGRDLSAVPIVSGVRGSDTRVTSVLFFPTLDAPRLETAVERALVRGGGDLMVQARVHSTDWWFLVGVSTLTVEGNVVDLEQLPPPITPAPEEATSPSATWPAAPGSVR